MFKRSQEAPSEPQTSVRNPSRAETRPSEPVPTSSLASLHQTKVDEATVVIGRGTRVTGQIDDCVLLDVYGVLEADVVADRLIIREGGGVRGAIRTAEAEIHGVVEGDLTVHGHLDVRATGVISGNVSYDSIAAAVGGKISGTMQIHEAPPVEEEVPAPVQAESPFAPPEPPVNGEVIDFDDRVSVISNVH